MDRRSTKTYEGVLLPSTTADHLVVKLDGGYNVGVDRSDADVEILETLDAVERYNDLSGSEKVGALIHSTC